jgi:thiol-disulfide isomerase/thioredoxin
MTDKKTDIARPSLPRLLLIAGLIGAAAGLAWVYGIGALKRNGMAGGDPECIEAVETAGKMKPLVHGEVAAVALNEKPMRVPDLMFHDASGKAVKLSDFRGRTLLVNLWATWCVPCRKEMPALDALMGKLGGPDFAIVAINIDSRDPEKPKKFLAEIGAKNLAYYEDPSGNVFQDLKRVGRALGLPTTLIVDKKGCEIGHIAGPAEWASEDAIKLVKAASAK